MRIAKLLESVAKYGEPEKADHHGKVIRQVLDHEFKHFRINNVFKLYSLLHPLPRHHGTRFYRETVPCA
jgi:hypothetical protein